MTLGHVIELITKNFGYSLAERSKNSLEATIKTYKYVTNHLSRYSSFANNNCSDCLKVLNICSLQTIRMFHSKEKIAFPLKNDEETILIKSFFQNGCSSNLIDMKWDTSTFD